ncbi:hypothetical protein Peur_028684 [Populus x canadensis]
MEMQLWSFLSPVGLSFNFGKKPKMKLINNVYLLYPSITHNIILNSEAHSPIGHGKKEAACTSLQIEAE